jgi:hypothetical protein
MSVVRKRIELINQIYNKYIEYNDLIKSYNNLPGIKNARRANFPEVISEFIIEKIKGYDQSFSGDLISKEKHKIEVKCFSSNGPISFGPNELWNKLVFVDCRIKHKIIIYEYDKPNNDDLWKNIKVSKSDTFQDQASKSRRPRINFNSLIKQIDIKKSFESDIYDILKDSSDIKNK